MAGRKVARDLLLANQCRCPLGLHIQQAASRRNGLVAAVKPLGLRQLSIFNEFTKQVKGEARSNSEFQQSVKELNEKVGGIKEDLRSRTKLTKEKLYKQVDGIWAEAETTTKKVSVDVKEKIYTTKEDVKKTLGIGEQDSSGFASTSTKTANDVNGRSDNSAGAEKCQSSETSDSRESDWKSETMYGRFKSTAVSFTPTMSATFQRLREAKLFDIAKKGYNVVKDELDSGPSKRKQIQYASSSITKEERSTRTDMVVLPSKKSRLGKKWEAFKAKMQDHPIFKRVDGISKPVVAKGQELAEDVRDRWETSDHPVVHKIQDINDTVFGETSTALSFKEIRRQDPYFSLPDFVAEVQEIVKPVLIAYLKCDVETLKKYCCPEVIERCKGERMAYESQGYFFDNKILHISEVDVRETKMMGSSPIIIVAFQTQQIYCVRDREGSVTAGGKDTIQTVYYAWAMQLVDAEELGEEVYYPMWRLREMQQIGVQALI